MLSTLGWLLTITATAFAFLTALHALMYKRDPRAASSWIVVCLALPVLGAISYWLLGVNRIRTRGRKLRQRWAIPTEMLEERTEEPPDLESAALPDHLPALVQISTRVTGMKLLPGNRVEALHNGEEAYPAMLEAISQAERSVHLSTYIFDPDRTGMEFVDALASATERGLDVRVLVDGVGEWYRPPRASTLLRARGVRVDRFLPPSLVPPSFHINLRNHRKILVVDGKLGFTGGMNISDRHLAGKVSNKKRAIDMHFRVQGPVVAQLQRVFIEEWAFVTGEDGQEGAVATPPRAGAAKCRVIVDGPNEDMDKLRWILLGAVSAAAKEVRVMTPYFLPDREMIGAFNAAALRGVNVNVLLPEHSDLVWVDWASRAMLWELLTYGVRVFLQPQPFVHSKLLLVDESYAMIGSANLDPRSLRLNFESNVEIHDPAFSAELTQHFERCRQRAREISLAEVDGRSFPCRVRDATARLFSPYL